MLDHVVMSWCDVTSTFFSFYLTVCGDAVVQNTVIVKELVQDLTDIYDQVLSAKDLVTKVGHRLKLIPI